MFVTAVRRCAFAAAVSAAVLAAAVVPTSALARSHCTSARHGAFCMDVKMSTNGLKVATVSAGEAGDTFICDFSAHVAFYLPGGASRVLRSGLMYRGACGARHAVATFPVHTIFPAGTRVCAGFYERGTRQGPLLCQTVA